MAREKVGIRDVAKLAGVSPATVSRVLNRPELVAERLRDQVHRAMARLGYAPNALARGLRTRHTGVLGLIVPDIAHPFFAEVVRGVEDVASREGYRVFLCNTDENPDKEEKYVAELLNHRVEGIIFISSSNSRAQLTSSSDVPVVVVDRRVSLDDLHEVLCDDVLGGRLATEHLLSLEHRHLAFLGGPQVIPNNADRLRGCREALAQAQLALDQALVAEVLVRVEAGERATEQLLDTGRYFSALFAANDLLAIGAVRALRARGLEVPGDVSVVGYDDVWFAAHLSPPLTTVAQPKRELGERAMQRLLALVRGQAPPERLVRMLPALVVRQSTAPPRHK
ncbi:MAG: LacI family DNA-binding transcriptional regulator [Deinococcus sp.]|nr:LacI family DNA-binding transcriptional regulator [Deinococcus sp.]